MNCEEFWNSLAKPPGSEFFEPGGEQRAHLLGCPACETRLARQRELAAGLRGLAESCRALKAPGRVEARLLRAFQAQHGAPAGGNRRWLLPVWATAASLLLAAALLLTMARQPAAPRIIPSGLKLASVGAAAAPDAAAEMETAGDTDGFIPLPNAESIGPNEEVNLVRVEVPRSALVALGVDVNPDQAAERVEADVLLGSDGVAKAVRFLD